MSDLSPADVAKRAAALRAAEFVEDGMRVGLGTGSTAAFLVRRLGERVRDEGLRLRCVPTSEATARLADEVGIEVVALDEVGWLDLTIDGADEADGELSLIKGGGGALLREKIVACASDRVVIIADGAKDVAALGAFPLPVEVIPFGWQATKRLIEEMLVGLDVGGREVVLRERGGAPFVTDEGNRILDLRLQRIGDARGLALRLNQIPGVVENGLFIDIADTLVLGFEDGRVEVRDLSGAQGTVPFRDADNVFSDLAD
ncbi:Ribose 5-phosphate isomerase A [Rubellimicrobium mesophilum DSM 19309]|uniref:Ribose-5-phosphate isomerase A n=1 Tax=Rubellimicrobium mesophilum DSM 19309 TaxID=442562 RepID=A0A017HEC5_9RHOB|nr:ribose-5-phosphate isomerase RpiA [Rubellimicrobium mesophilum]EYD72129.1 Ribose 5-phosphate isomerase A [Rubellimicrobium mesophilum DSM 19309]